MVRVDLIKKNQLNSTQLKASMGHAFLSWRPRQAGLAMVLPPGLERLAIVMFGRECLEENGIVSCVFRQVLYCCWFVFGLPLPNTHPQLS